MAPAMVMAAVSSVVATGRRMNGAEKFIVRTKAKSVIPSAEVAGRRSGSSETFSEMIR